MKYLFMTRNKFPPYRVDVKVLFGEELTRRGHEIDWLMPSESPRRRSGIARYGNGRVWVSAAVHGDNPFAKLWRLLQEFGNNLRVFGILRSGDYQFVLVKDKFVGGGLALLAARLAGVKFVFWLAYPFPESWIYEARSKTARFPAFSLVRGTLSRFLLYRLILPNADLAVVQSQQMLEDVAREGISRDKLCAVPMGVSSEFLADTVAAEPRQQPPVVLYVGTMIRVRRLDFLLRAFKQVLQVTPHALLYMVGGESSEDIDWLRKEADDLGIADSVCFTGPLPQPEAIVWMRRASVCVSPFYPTPILNSTSPTKLVEYMSQGTAVVANEHPEQSKVIAESGAGLCVPYDEQAFASAITALLDDPVRAEQMGACGQAYVRRNRGYPMIADQVDNRLRQLVAADAGSRSAA